MGEKRETNAQKQRNVKLGMKDIYGSGMQGILFNRNSGTVFYDWVL